MKRAHSIELDNFGNYTLSDNRLSELKTMLPQSRGSRVLCAPMLDNVESAAWHVQTMIDD